MVQRESNVGFDTLWGRLFDAALVRHPHLVGHEAVQEQVRDSHERQHSADRAEGENAGQDVRHCKGRLRALRRELQVDEWQQDSAGKAPMQKMLPSLTSRRPRAGTLGNELTHTAMRRHTLDLETATRRHTWQ